MFLKTSQNSQENICVRVSFLVKLQASACNYIKKDTLAQTFPWEFRKTYKNTFFTEHLRATASGNLNFLNQTCGLVTYKIMCKRWKIWLQNIKLTLRKKMLVFGVVLVRFQSKCGIMRSRIAPTTNTFYSVLNITFIHWTCLEFQEK